MTETAPGRWHAPRLAGDQAGDLATSSEAAEELAAATGRVVDYYLRASAAADLLINPHRLRNA